MVRSTLAVTANSSEIEKPKGTGAITRRKSSAIAQNNANVPEPIQAQAIALEELNNIYDPDLQLAFFQRLINHQEEIKQQATMELQIAKAEEFARLEAIEHARQQGIQEARADMNKIKSAKKLEAQMKFINVQIPALAKQYENRSDQDFKHVLDEFAKRMDVSMNWGTDENGDLTYDPKPRN